MPAKLIIFDWDGTLADTTAPIISTMQVAFEMHGIDAPSAEIIRSYIGYSLTKMMTSIAPQCSQEISTKIMQTYSELYLNPNHHNTRLFDTVIPCLNTLKQQGYWLAIATGKGRTGLNNAIEQTYTQDYWLATRCASECPSKPAPDMVLELCDELGIMPNEAIVIGDTTFDLEMAQNAHTRAIGITTGAHSKQQLQQMPNLTILNHLSELPDFLTTI